MSDKQPPSKPTPVRSRPQTVASKNNVDNVNPNTEKEVGLQNVIDKLTSEGQLIRNTGTNSLKSINEKLVKFDGVFNSIHKEISVQTSVLKNMLNETYLEQHRRKEKEDEDRILDSEERERRKHEKNGSKDKDDPRNKASGGGIVDSFMDGGWISLLLGIPARAMIGIGAMVGADMVVEYILTKAKDWGVPDMFVEAIAEPLKNGALWGGIGLAISKRFGLYGLVAGSVWPLAEKILDVAGIEDITIMGLNLSDIFGAILGGSAIFLTSALFKDGMARKLMTSSFLGNLANNGKLLKGFSRLGVGIAGVVSMGILLLEEPLKNMLEGMGLSEEMANGTINAISTAANGAAIGAMIGGIPGMIVGAAVGLAISVGTSIWQWFTDEERIAKKSVDDALALMDKMKDPNALFTTQDAMYAKQQMQEAESRGNTKGAELWGKIHNELGSRTGVEVVDPAKTKDYQSYISSNIADLEKNINAIADNASLSDEEKKSQIVSIIDQIQKQFPQFSHSQITQDLISQISDVNWSMWGGDNDGNDHLTSIANGDYLPKLYTDPAGNVKNLDVGYEEFKKSFKEFFGYDFDPNNVSSSHILWIQDNPDAAAFWEGLYKQQQDQYGVGTQGNYTTFFNPQADMEREAGMTDAEYEAFRNQQAEYLYGGKIPTEILEKLAVQKEVTITTNVTNTTYIGGDTNVVATHNTQGGSSNFYGSRGTSNRTSVPGGIGGQ